MVSFSSSCLSLSFSTLTMKLLIFILFFVPYCALAFDVKTVIDSPMLTQKVGTNRTIKVDINGNGEFKSVQAAIDSIPEGNSNWVIIHIRKGVYRYKFNYYYIHIFINYYHYFIINHTCINQSIDINMLLIKLILLSQIEVNYTIFF